MRHPFIKYTYTYNIFPNKIDNINIYKKQINTLNK